MRYCKKCGKTMQDTMFYYSNNLDKHPEGKMELCKKCTCMHVDNWNPETFKPILKDADVPYVEEKWNEILRKYVDKDPSKITGMTVMGRYLATMKLAQWNQYRWEDTALLEEKTYAAKLKAMTAQGMTEEEIEEAHAMAVPDKPVELTTTKEELSFKEEEEDEFQDSLTEEDKTMLRLKWGRTYRPEEWVRMEQLYRDMMESYDIQSAGHKDTLIMLCKASLKANQLLDIGDIEGAQKIAKVYDNLMRSGKFTAAQNKEESSDDVDSIGAIVAICERDGFIPRYYVSKPADHVDRVIQDMQQYTHDLVTEELGLGNLIENSLKALEREKASIQNAALDGEDANKRLEEELFNYETSPVADEDFAEFAEFKEEETEKDGEWL